MTMSMLPAAPGACPVCFFKHDADDAHNPYSLSYCVRFSAAHGRSPTWADAIAHLPPAIAERWRTFVVQKGKWTEPSDGKPIAEPIDSVPRGVPIPLGQPVVVPK